MIPTPQNSLAKAIRVVVPLLFITAISIIHVFPEPVDFKRMVEIADGLHLETGQDSTTILRPAEEDPVDSGVNQGHGAHQTRLVGEVGIVPGA